MQRYSTNHHVKSAFTCKAGALWPYRLVTSIWKQLLTTHPASLSIETHTPVTSITSVTTTTKPATSTTTTYPLTVHTPRGPIHARHVVHATNAFAPELVPGLRGKMTGLLAHMSAQSPGARFPDLGGARSWSIVYGDGFDYVTQRPSTTTDGSGSAAAASASAPGKVLLGGGWRYSRERGLDMLGVYDDARLDPGTVAHNLGVLPAIFQPNWGQPVAGVAGDEEDGPQVWSGVVALTADGLPLVGRLDPRITGRDVVGGGGGGGGEGEGEGKPGAEVAPGEWIAASFMGDGMVWAWLCGTALGVMLAGTEEDAGPQTAVPGRPEGRLTEWFPPELLATYERVGKMDIADLVDDM